MEVLGQLAAHPVVAIVVLLGVLVFVHEAGHFLVGKLCGIAVEVFSIGFGPVVFAIKRGETHYRLSLVPLGGFVKFYGAVAHEEVPGSVVGREFYRAGLWQRFLTIAAGPFANFLLAAVCYFALAWHGTTHLAPEVGEVRPGSPAEQAGLRYGDLVVAMDGEPLSTWRELHRQVSKAGARTIEMVVERDGQRLNLQVQPELVEVDGMLGAEKVGRIGISPGRLPAAVAITDEQGLAYLAGLRTGDLITQVNCGSELQEVKYYRQVEALLQSQTVMDGCDGGQFELIVERDGGQQAFYLAADQSLSVTRLGWGPADLVVAESKAAQQDVLQKHDRLLAWNGQEVRHIFDYAKVAGKYLKSEVLLTVQRGVKVVDVTVELKPVEVQEVGGKVTYYTLPVRFAGGLIAGRSFERQYSGIEALQYSLSQTWQQSALIATAVYQLFTGQMPLKALGGPISIAKVASDSAQMGWVTFVKAMALISINLGLLNLVPIPVLDGGQLMVLGIEAVRRRPLSVAAFENFQKVGFAMILCLVVMATYNDLSRFWVNMLEGLAGMIP